MAKLETLDVVLKATTFDYDDFNRGWAFGFVGEPVPEGSTDVFILAHAKGAERAVEDAVWRAGERAQEARDEGYRQALLDVAYSLAMADNVGDIANDMDALCKAIDLVLPEDEDGYDLDAIIELGGRSCHDPILKASS